MAKNRRAVATFDSFKALRPAVDASQGRVAAIAARYGQGNPQGWGLDSTAAATDTTNRPTVAAAGEIGRSGHMRGTIKKIDTGRAFGFIRGEDGTDYFFHKSGMAHGVEFHELEEGEAVNFEAGEGAKGPRAEAIERA